ncbi:MAG: ROK family transcriptional regulator [Pseudoflavonifractor sp.]
MVGTQKVDRDLMRNSNTRLVLSTIYKARELSKAQIAAATKMSVVSVGRIADELVMRGFVREQVKLADGQAVGRPPKVLSLAADQLLCCGVFLEREALHLGLMDPYGVLEAEELHPFSLQESFAPEEILPLVADKLAAFLRKQQLLHSILGTVGVVVPGIVDLAAGALQYASNFTWSNVPIAPFLHARLPDYDFVLENDIKAVATAEHRFGSAANCNNMVILNVGNGIGAAVILNGQIYRGKNNMAGEIGHIIINPGGKICECGQAGCLQTNIARWAILAEARCVYPGVTLPELFALCARGDSFAVALIEKVVDYTAIAISLLANTYSPETILLCGSTIRQNPLFKTMLLESYKSKLNDYIRDSFALRFESFSRNSHIIGGGAVAFNHELGAMVF